MSALPKITYYTAEEYLRLEREAPYKSEYFKGEIFAMAGASTSHNRIKENLSIGIGSYLRRNKGCQSFSSDMRVHIPENTLYTYPDVLVVCGRLEFLDNEKDILLNPSVIIEVLSKSTQTYDRGDKFHLYRSIPTLREYLMVDSQSVRVEMYRKADDGVWSLVYDTKNIEDTIELITIGLSISIEDMYDQAEFRNHF